VDAKQSYVMRSNGSVATFAAAAKCSVQTILIGPAAGVVAASRTMTATPGVANIVTFDMGGTSTDVALSVIPSEVEGPPRSKPHRHRRSRAKPRDRLTHRNVGAG
jgi:N-methylhydantoinase A/oxoprolinase/acetone carboxylase beta subunit